MIESILKGLTLGFLLSISVGPILFAVIKQSLNNGYRGGIAFVLGVSFSDITWVLISNVFTEFLRTIETYKTEIGLTGAIFLICLGIYFLFFKKASLTNKEEFLAKKIRKRDYLRLFLSGFFMNFLQPGVFIFWVSTSTVLITDSINDRIIIFIICLGWVLFTDLLKVFFAHKIRQKLTLKNIHLINRINGLILAGFGISIIMALFYFIPKK